MLPTHQKYLAKQKKTKKNLDNRVRVHSCLPFFISPPFFTKEQFQLPGLFWNAIWEVISFLLCEQEGHSPSTDSVPPASAATSVSAVATRLKTCVPQQLRIRDSKEALDGLTCDILGYLLISQRSGRLWIPWHLVEPGR